VRQTLSAAARAAALPGGKLGQHDVDSGEGVADAATLLELEGGQKARESLLQVVLVPSHLLYAASRCSRLKRRGTFQGHAEVEAAKAGPEAVLRVRDEELGELVHLLHGAHVLHGRHRGAERDDGPEGVREFPRACRVDNAQHRAQRPQQRARRLVGCSEHGPDRAHLVGGGGTLPGAERLDQLGPELAGQKGRIAGLEHALQRGGDLVHVEPREKVLLEERAARVGHRVDGAALGGVDDVSDHRIAPVHWLEEDAVDRFRIDPKVLDDSDDAAAKRQGI
jgi:hypothetical protein